MRFTTVACEGAVLSGGRCRCLRRPLRRHPIQLCVKDLLGRPCEEELRVRLERSYLGRDGVPVWPPPLLQEHHADMEVKLETGGPGGPPVSRGGGGGGGRGDGGGGHGGDGGGEDGSDDSFNEQLSSRVLGLLFSAVFIAFYVADQWDQEDARRRDPRRQDPRRSCPY